MTAPPDWAESSRRLADLLRSALGGVLAGAAAEGPAARPSSEGDCRWCPVCQLVAVLRGERPEVTAALADVLTATANALHALAAASAAQQSGSRQRGSEQPGSRQPGSEQAGSEQPGSRRPDEGPVVQRIDIA